MMQNKIKSDDIIFNFFKQICDEKDDIKCVELGNNWISAMEKNINNMEKNLNKSDLIKFKADIDSNKKHLNSLNEGKGESYQGENWTELKFFNILIEKMEKYQYGIDDVRYNDIINIWKVIKERCNDFYKNHPVYKRKFEDKKKAEELKRKMLEMAEGEAKEAQRKALEKQLAIVAIPINLSKISKENHKE